MTVSGAGVVMRSCVLVITVNLQGVGHMARTHRVYMADSDDPGDSGGAEHRR
jgi:hypothetical protein